MTRTFFVFLLAFFATAPAVAQDAAAPAPLEIVKQDIDIEAAPDGQSWQVMETRLRPLTALGVKALQQNTLSYTAGYQTLAVEAYTLKKDGRRIDIAPQDMLQGHGETSAPGFEDTRTLTVVFPNLEVGDQAVTITRSVQLVPWFPNVFAVTQIFSNAVVVREARLAFTARGNISDYRIQSSGVTAEPPVTLAGKTRHVWRFRNERPVKPEAGAVDEVSSQPRVEITNQASYASIGALYSDLFRGRADVTPEISALAQKLTDGVRDRREQARMLYEYVATRIEYVNIVLGAGGFLPHKASDVLKNGHGDCKDHVMLLQALLEAKGIKSSSVLIRAGTNQFTLPLPSPFLFDHLISYIPEFDLYLDSTSRYAPFGVLPGADAGKAVVIVESGRTAVTPPDSAAQSSMRVETSLKINADGSADGESKVHATGPDAVSARAGLASLPSEQDAEYFKAALGPGSSGTFQRGKLDVLSKDYAYSAKFHVGHVANFSGPGAIPALIGYRPFSFSSLIGLDLPATREHGYVCASGRYQDDLTISLPSGIGVLSVPAGVTLATDGTRLQTRYELVKSDTIRVQVNLDLDRPGPVCRAADYARIRPVLSGMINALLVQILYR